MAVYDEQRLFRPVQSRRTFEEAIEEIAYAVRVGDLRVGDRLPPERTLAALMQISRPTVREAIKVLAHAGIVKVEPPPTGSMAIASDVVPPSLLAAQIELKIGEVASVLEARRVIEPHVAQLAGIYATDIDYQRLATVLEEQRARIGDETRFAQYDERFHISVARATGNPTIVSIMRGILRKLAIAWEMVHRVPGDAEHDLEIHERTLTALKSRDPTAIATVMDEHLAILERWWERETGRPRLRRATR
jgi:DNA-binding FadR family transcriptional regulator